MKFRISAIQANPFRNIDRYPIREDKITALRESLRTTGFWDNVVARVVDGVPQIAYGHHRREALLREYPADYEVSLIVRDLSDDAMLKIMARENLEEWGTSAAVEHETVRAVVQAYADGKITLPRPSPMSRGLRHAPLFSTDLSSDRSGDKSYTAQSIADFLGWTDPSGKPQEKVFNALAALAFIEDGTLTETDFAGLSTAQAGAVVEQARRAKAAADLHAKEERQRAEQAQRDAAAAEQRRAAAEAERQRRVAEAAAAREENARRAAQSQADRAARQAAEAERQRIEAARRQESARLREAEQREIGQRRAAATGRHVSQALRGGEGYKNATRIADEVRPESEKTLPDIDRHASQLASALNKILDAAVDQRAQQLDTLIRFQSNMTASSLRGLLMALDHVIERAEGYRRKLITPTQNDTVDGDVIQPQRAALMSGHRNR